MIIIKPIIPGSSYDGMEQAPLGEEWGIVKYDYDIDGNIAYKGLNTNRNASDNDITWTIIKYTYSLDDIAMKEKRTTSWTSRNTGW